MPPKVLSGVQTGLGVSIAKWGESRQEPLVISYPSYPSRNSPVSKSHPNFSICSGKPEAHREVHLLWGTLAVDQATREALPHERLLPCSESLAQSISVHVQIRTCYCFAREVPLVWPKFAFFLMNNINSENQKKIHPKNLKTMVTLNL